MKKVFLIAFSSVSLLAGCSQGGSENEHSNSSTAFYVRGNCEQCEERIEKAAKSVDGVASADWNVDTDMIKVDYDSTKTSQLKIEEAIAAMGHGTEHVQMNQQAHEKLPDCCKVDEEEEAAAKRQ
jgi:Cu(I)/Ag(I) efflux system membrane fusion protein